MADDIKKDDKPLRTFSVIAHWPFVATFSVQGVDYADACERMVKQFREGLTQVPKPTVAPTSKVGALLGKLNANKIGRYEPGQLKCIGANADGKPLFRAKLPSWNGFAVERQKDEHGNERTVRVPVENYPSVEMPAGEVLKDVLRDKAA